MWLLHSRTRKTLHSSARMEGKTQADSTSTTCRPNVMRPSAQVVVYLARYVVTRASALDRCGRGWIAGANLSVFVHANQFRLITSSFSCRSKHQVVTEHTVIWPLKAPPSLHLPLLAELWRGGHPQWPSAGWPLSWPPPRTVPPPRGPRRSAKPRMGARSGAADQAEVPACCGHPGAPVCPSLWRKRQDWFRRVPPAAFLTLHLFVIVLLHTWLSVCL